ncbi:MAG: hypothetical protein Q4B26_06700 [Eubacteriales bacterium]|nr:hypothetical protein [Eubacteriales bacterium]
MVVHDTFVKEYLAIIGNRLSGFCEVLKSDFYNKSSFAYCVFLEIFYAEPNLQKYTFLYYPDGESYPAKQESFYLPDQAAAENRRNDLRESTGYFVEYKKD